MDHPPQSAKISRKDLAARSGLSLGTVTALARLGKIDGITSADLRFRQHLFPAPCTPKLEAWIEKTRERLRRYAVQRESRARLLTSGGRFTGDKAILNAETTILRAIWQLKRTGAFERMPGQELMRLEAALFSIGECGRFVRAVMKRRGIGMRRLGRRAAEGRV